MPGLVNAVIKMYYKFLAKDTNLFAAEGYSIEQELAVEKISQPLDQTGYSTHSDVKRNKVSEKMKEAEKVRIK